MGETGRPPLSDAAQQRLRDNVARVRDGIAAACRQAGRSSDDITLVAVTKYVSADIARHVLAAGVINLAESRPQVLWEKAMAMAHDEPHPRWHLVGHLQRNKLRRTLAVLGVLQSLDSFRLLETLEAEVMRATDASRMAEATPWSCLDVLVEVNLTDDPGRSGAAIDDVPTLVAAAARSPCVRLRGLMGMAARPDARTDARRDFARLRLLRDSLVATLPDPAALGDLSMGMSEDFEAGILEGATMVRIGSALFEGVE